MVDTICATTSSTKSERSLIGAGTIIRFGDIFCRRIRAGLEGGRFSKRSLNHPLQIMAAQDVILVGIHLR
jgi:hypothetical protein